MSKSIKRIVLTEDDLKEIFSLFTSSTVYERDQIYERSSSQHFLRVNPLEEYTLTEEKREFAIDAWRAVIYFLHSRGYLLVKGGKLYDLSFIEDDFIP